MANKTMPRGKLDFLVVAQMTMFCILTVHGQDVVPIIGGSVKSQSSYTNAGIGKLKHR